MLVYLQKMAKLLHYLLSFMTTLRVGTAELIQSLYAQGVNVEILSGDNQDAVDAIAKEIGVQKIAARGEMTPESKVEWVKERSKTHITMMVGDGFNDAAAMAAADIGIAIGTGESANLEAADVLIPDDPRLISDLLKLAKELIQSFCGISDIQLQ